MSEQYRCGRCQRTTAQVTILILTLNGKTVTICLPCLNKANRAASRKRPSR